MSIKCESQVSSSLFYAYLFRVMFRLQYEPDPVIDIRPFTNIIAPDPSHFQTVHMTGGKAIVLGSPTSLLNRRRSSAGLTAGAGVHGDVSV